MTYRMHTLFVASQARHLVMALGLSGTLVAPAWAGGLRELDQTIFGMDCAPCAAGIEKGIGRLHGVRSVRVSLNDGEAVVSLVPEGRTTLAQIREVIRHNGFTPKDARATYVGRVRRDGDRLWLETGSERFVLAADDAALEREANSAGSDQELRLSVRIPERLTDPPAVQLVTVAAGT